MAGAKNPREGSGGPGQDPAEMGLSGVSELGAYLGVSR